ncbi:MAG: hypothetical protein LBE12_16935 [Planctomycetaceae bacterium]|jgi:cytosine permease|nr:hypothetical protein [Planctomycetaceae bacterium]
MLQLPDYVASAKPNSKENRVGWLTSTAATYAGVMLWFVFWQQVPMGAQGIAGGTLSQGLGLAIGSLILAAFICHFLFYLAPGMLGMKTGLPLAVVGTSTYGVTGGFLMPGLLMGLLQFGWLSVNAYFSGLLLVSIGGVPEGSVIHLLVSTLWALIAMFMGIMGIQYVGKIASFMPIIPIAILLLLLAKTIGNVGEFSAEQMLKAAPETANPATLYGSGILGIFSLMGAYVIGFFATAGAAGVNFGCGNKDGNAVQLGGLVGIVLSTVFTGVISLLVVAGTQKIAISTGNTALLAEYDVTKLFSLILGDGTAKICMFLLAFAAFPSACFCTFIAAGCTKTSFPKINQWISCGIGCAAAIALVIFGYAKDAPAVFGVIGASFGPICGAMTADYLLAGKKWIGPRAGFNPAGWLSWLVGFIVGGIGMVYPIFTGEVLPFEIPCPPLSAFVVGFVLYIFFAKIGLQSKVLDLPQRIDV